MNERGAEASLLLLLKPVPKRLPKDDNRKRSALVLLSNFANIDHIEHDV
jgi:hypothetical protein